MFEKFSKRKIIILAVLVVALPLAVYLVRQAVTFIPRAVPGAVGIFFIPDTASLPPDTTFALNIDAKSNLLGFVRIELDFDSSRINLTDEIQTTDKLKTVIKKTSKSEANSSGNIVVVIGLSPEDKGNPPTGVFEFMRMTFGKVAGSGSTNITVNDTGVQIVDLDANELAFTSSSATVNLTTPTPTYTPTSTSTPTPTPTSRPTNTPTPKPTNTPTPKPGTPTPTPTQKPTPTGSYIQGDIDGDGDVDIFDYNLMVTNFGATGNNPADIDGDGDVDIFDYNLLITNFGRTSGTPTPTNKPPTSTPTPPSGSPTPTPTPPTGQPYRAFSADSYWNTIFPANAPIDSHNAEYIADSQNSSHTQNYLRFTAAPGTSQGFGQPIYWASSTDKLYTISDGSLTVQVHIPKGATPAGGSDGQITIYDLSTNQVVGISGAHYDATSDKWTVGGSIDRYMLSSNGLDSKAAGSNDSRNTGHRGTTTAVRAVRVDEVQKGAINHRLACFWWATGTQTVNHYWPMVGDEGAKGGIVPEGIVIRIKPSVNLSTKGLSQPALVIAKALQQYGCLVTDNSGSGNRLKLELNEAAWTQIGIKENSLSSIPWSDWEFIQGGYKP